MARDTEQNAYFSVGIPRDSETYRLLKQDARESDIGIPKLIALRMSDWYRLTKQIALVSVAPQETVTDNVDEAGDEDQPEIDQGKLNAAAALDEWM